MTDGSRNDPAKARRQHARAKLMFDVHVRTDKFSTFISEQATTIGTGGMFIASQEPKPPGSIINFEFVLGEESQKLISGTGEVRWRRLADECEEGQEPGMGIQFINLDRESLEVIEKIVNLNAPRGAKAALAASGAHEIFQDLDENELLAKLGEDDAASAKKPMQHPPEPPPHQAAARESRSPFGQTPKEDEIDRALSLFDEAASAEAPASAIDETDKHDSLAQEAADERDDEFAEIDEAIDRVLPAEDVIMVSRPPGTPAPPPIDESQSLALPNEPVTDLRLEAEIEETAEAPPLHGAEPPAAPPPHEAEPPAPLPFDLLEEPKPKPPSYEEQVRKAVEHIREEPPAPVQAHAEEMQAAEVLEEPKPPSYEEEVHVAVNLRERASGPARIDDEEIEVAVEADLIPEEVAAVPPPIVPPPPSAPVAPSPRAPVRRAPAPPPPPIAEPKPPPPAASAEDFFDVDDASTVMVDAAELMLPGKSSIAAPTTIEHEELFFKVDDEPPPSSLPEPEPEPEPELELLPVPAAPAPAPKPPPPPPSAPAPKAAPASPPKAPRPLAPPPKAAPPAPATRVSAPPDSLRPVRIPTPEKPLPQLADLDAPLADTLSKLFEGEAPFTRPSAPAVRAPVPPVASASQAPLPFPKTPAEGASAKNDERRRRPTEAVGSPRPTLEEPAPAAPRRGKSPALLYALVAVLVLAGGAGAVIVFYPGLVLDRRPTATRGNAITPLPTKGTTKPVSTPSPVASPSRAPSPSPSPSPTATATPPPLTASPVPSPSASPSPTPRPSPSPTTTARPSSGAVSSRIVRVDAAQQGERFVLSVQGDGGNLPYKTMQLEEPPRVVVDVPGVGYDDKRATIDVSSPLVSRVRVGHYPDKIRFVLDVVGRPRVTAEDQGGTVRVTLQP